MIKYVNTLNMNFLAQVSSFMPFKHYAKMLAEGSQNAKREKRKKYEISPANNRKVQTNCLSEKA